MLFRRLAQLAFFVCIVGLTISFADATEFQEGKDYKTVTGFPEDSSKVVREFFSYNCPHCYHQDALFLETAKLLQGKVDFVRTPVGAGRSEWIMSQKAYYIALQLKLTSQVHSEIFNRIHEQNLPFQRSQDLIDFYTKQGASKSEVVALISSPEMKLELANYDAQTQLSGIRGVPSLVVNGKYLINHLPKQAAVLAELIEYLANK